MGDPFTMKITYKIASGVLLLAAVLILWDRCVYPGLIGRAFFSAAKVNVAEMQTIVQSVCDFREATGRFPGDLREAATNKGLRLRRPLDAAFRDYLYRQPVGTNPSWATVVLAEHLNRYRGRPGGHIATLDGAVTWFEESTTHSNYTERLHQEARSNPAEIR